MLEMKNLFSLLISFFLIGLVVHYQKPITAFVLNEFIYKHELEEYQTNNYSKTTNYEYVKLTEDFYPQNEEDIKNAFYTIIDSGMTSFSLFCSEKYENCLKDVERISTDYNILSHINNLVHPYNSYDKLYITTNTFGKINISIQKLYSDQEIQEVNEQLESIKRKIINNMSTRDKIKAFHDYVINTTKYDKERSKILNDRLSTDNIRQTHKATGVLKNHIALCSGYTDLMAIFLSDIGVPNYKISNDSHVWNAVYLDNKWYHLDLTWDDPVTDTGENLLIYDFFLITTQQLEKLDTYEHYYDKTVYGF